VAAGTAATTSSDLIRSLGGFGCGVL
jgi:hypothetical protein